MGVQIDYTSLVLICIRKSYIGLINNDSFRNIVTISKQDLAQHTSTERAYSRWLVNRGLDF